MGLGDLPGYDAPVFADFPGVPKPLQVTMSVRAYTNHDAGALMVVGLQYSTGLCVQDGSPCVQALRGGVGTGPAASVACA